MELNDWPTTEQIEEMVEISKWREDIVREYKVNNMTFSSDAKDTSPTRVELYFNHLPFDGRVYVLQNGDIVAENLLYRPRITGHEAFNCQLELFRKYLGAELFKSQFVTCKDHYNSFVIPMIRKPKGEFATYETSCYSGEHGLAFVFEEPNSITTRNALYKIHTIKKIPIEKSEIIKREK